MGIETTTSSEKDVPIPPPRVFTAAALGGLVGAAAGAMLVIWLIGCDCCDCQSDTRTTQVEAFISVPLSDSDRSPG